MAAKYDMAIDIISNMWPGGNLQCAKVECMIIITEEEWRLLKQYRNLCEENKLTINILIQRLLAHEKGRE